MPRDICTYNLKDNTSISLWWNCSDKTIVPPFPTSSEQDSSTDLYDHLSLSVRKDAAAESYDHLNDLNPIAKIPNALKVKSTSFSTYDCLERFIRVDSIASEASSLYGKLNWHDDRRIDYVVASPRSLEPAYAPSVKEIANPHIGPVLAHYDVADRGMVSSLVKSLPPVTALTLVSAWAPILVNDENPFEGSRSASDYEMAPTGGFSSLKGSSAGTNAHRPPAAPTFNLGHHDEESLYDMEGAAQPYDTMVLPSPAGSNAVRSTFASGTLYYNPFLFLKNLSYFLGTFPTIVILNFPYS